MATWQDVITAAQTLLQRWKRDVDFTSQIVNGPATGPTSVVNTDGGTIPTFAKTLGDAAAESQSLRSDIANTTDSAKGAALVGFLQSGTGAVGRTVRDRLLDVVSIFDFMTAAQISDARSRTASLDLTTAFNNAFAAAECIYLPPGTYRVTNTIGTDKTGLSTKTVLMGAGIGVSNIVFDHYNTGIQILGNSSTNTEMHLSGFSVSRNNPNGYGGTIGPKSILCKYAKNATIKGVEESGAIGFGIQFWLSSNVEVSGCYVHDHKGGATGPTGTDGIHFYVCAGAKAIGNRVENVGDDAISFGSFDPAKPTTDVLASGNTIKNGGGGGIKNYAFVQRSCISGNVINGVTNGGIYLTDDSTSPANALVSNVEIFGNQFTDCIGTSGNFEGGAVRLRLWPGATTANMQNISIRRNKAVNCRTGAVAWAYGATKRFSNIAVSQNEFLDPPASFTGDNPAIYVIQCDGDLEIKGNLIRNCASMGIDLNNVNGGYSATWNNTVISIEDNIVDGYSLEVASGTAHRGIWLRGTDITTICNIRNNKILRQKAGNGITPERAIETAANISPLSNVELNYDDGSGTGFAIGTSVSYKGSDRFASAVPAAGTHYSGIPPIMHSAPATGVPSGWRCKTSGTFGTLSGVTGTMTSGDRVVVVNDVTNLFPGAVISVAGAVTSAIVLSISGLNVTLSAAATATVSSVAVAYVTPAFQALANFP